MHSTGAKKGKNKDSSNPFSLKDKNKKKIKCFYCKKVGHKQNKCQKKLVDEKNDVNKESSNNA